MVQVVGTNIFLNDVALRGCVANVLDDVFEVVTE